MTAIDEIETDSVVAVADLCARSGATSFELGYLDDNPARPRWYATAFFRGARLIADEKASPDEAADGLARRLLSGGQCTGCQRVVTLSDKGGGCRWHRDGPSWVRGCDGKREATKR